MYIINLRMIGMGKAEKIRILLLKQGSRKEKDIAELLGIEPQSLSRKMKVNNFTQAEMEKIADFLGATWTVEHNEWFTIKNSGEKI
jgi:transcriptional regulator with XRE-family HTH domain